MGVPVGRRALKESEGKGACFQVESFPAASAGTTLTLWTGHWHPPGAAQTPVWRQARGQQR